MTGQAASRAGGRTASVVAVVHGIGLAVVGAFWVGFGGAGLGHVSLTRAGVVGPTLAPSSTWAVLTLVTALALVLLVGPRRSGGVDLVAVVGGLWTLGWLAVFSVLGSGWELSGPSAACVRPGCFPRGWQEAAVGLPLALAALTLVGAGLVGGRWPRWVGRGLPAVVFVLLTVVQLSQWDRVVVPLLLGGA